MFTPRNAQITTVGKIVDPRTHEERDIGKGMTAQFNDSDDGWDNRDLEYDSDDYDIPPLLE